MPVDLDLYEDEVQDLERRSASWPSGPGTVAFYGGSSIRLWSSLAEDFPGINCVNLGFGGATLDACEGFFERLVLPRNPSLIVLYAGDNDLGIGDRPDAVHDAYRRFVSKVDTLLGAPVFFLAIKPSPARWFIQRRVIMANDMIRLELLNRPGDQYIDVHSPMLDKSTGKPDPGLYFEDGLHLSREGYALWAEVVRPFLKPFAEEPPSWY